MGFLEGDQSAGELEEGEVVLGFLRPADQEGAVAVQPGVAGFDDPTAGAPAGSGAFQAEFVAAATDALSVGFGPVAWPPSGALPVAPSHDNQAQSIPTCSS